MWQIQRLYLIKHAATLSHYGQLNEFVVYHYERQLLLDILNEVCRLLALP